MSILSAKKLNAATKEALEAVEALVATAQSTANAAKTRAEQAIPNGSITLAMLNAALLEPAANVFGLRKIGTGALEAKAGNAKSAKRQTKIYEIEEPSNRALLPIIIPKFAAGETVSLVEVVAILASGTLTVEIQRNGSAVTGLGAVAASSTLKQAVPTGGPVALAEKDQIKPVLSASATPGGLTLEVVLEHES